VRNLLRTLILVFVRILGLPAAYAAARRTRKDPPPDLRILLVRPDHLGDMVMTTPVLQALRSQAPEAQITMLGGPWSSEVVARHPAIDHLITLPFPGFQRTAQRPLEPYRLLFSTAQQLRRKRYDIALNLRPDFWWGGALLYLAGIPRRVGYAIEPGTPFLTHALPFPVEEHATVSSLRLASAGLQACGLPALTEPFTPARYPLQFAPTTQERAFVSERLASAGIGADDALVVIHPGTGGAVKLWRIEAWSHIADRLSTTDILPAAAHIVLTGSPKERPMLEEITRDMHTQALLVTDMTVGQLAALLGRAQLVLGVDNGPLHLAVAQDTLTLHIFGPSNPRIFGPWGTPGRHLIVAATERCPGCPAIPCGRLDFASEELPAHPCVRRISEQQVEQAIELLVASRSNRT